MNKKIELLPFFFIREFLVHLSTEFLISAILISNLLFVLYLLLIKTLKLLPFFFICDFLVHLSTEFCMSAILISIAKFPRADP